MLSISFWFRKLSGFFALPEPRISSPSPEEVLPPANGTPSTTIRGSFPERTDEFPLTLIATPAPGSPVELVI